MSRKMKAESSFFVSSFTFCPLTALLRVVISFRLSVEPGSGGGNYDFAS